MGAIFIKTEMKTTIKTRIKNEIANLQELFSGVTENEMDFLMKHFEEVAFQKVMMEDLRSKMVESGTTDEYQNGANQFGTKMSAEMNSYEHFYKLYQASMKFLSQYLPKEKKDSKLTQFLNG